MTRPHSTIFRSVFLVAVLTIDLTAVSRANSQESPGGQSNDAALLRPLDVFQLEYASDPQIAPDGQGVVYVRNHFDLMKDRRRGNLWWLASDGSQQRPLTTGNRNYGTPRWSPDGRRLAYLADADGTTQLFVRWMDSGQTAQLTQLTNAPRDLCWSPDGRWLAFLMLVPSSSDPLVKMPAKPDGAEWAEPFKVIRRLEYRADGSGYLKEGTDHVFVVPSDGGTARQLTSGDFSHEGPLSWSADGQAILFSGNRNADWEHQPVESEVYEVTVATGAVRQLTRRVGPDHHPVVSPDGRLVAYLGFDDKKLGYQVTRLYVMQRDGQQSRCLSTNVDRDLGSPLWSRDGRQIYCQYDDQGVTKVGAIRLTDKLEPGPLTNIATNVGGAAIGRPYPSGSFSVSDKGTIAFTQGTVDRPSDVAVVPGAIVSGANDPGAIISGAVARPQRLTDLNADLLGPKKLGAVEPIRFESSADQRSIQGWVVKPPNFDPGRKYPLLLEIHGGPFANYGERFSAEMQLYAAAGYVVLYCNPRGSTSYGAEFGNLIHHNYPSQDYDDLMSGVDAVIQKGYIDERNLFVTGGSGGGVLTAWIVGKTGRFRAAVSAKPVINWYSFALTADKYAFFYQYWFPGPPWEHAEHYLKRSPLSLVGKVTTPTMLLTGEQDHRTPISESEQFYQALKLRKVDTALVRVPGASHDITARPSHLISQVLHTLAWFERYRQP